MSSPVWPVSVLAGVAAAQAGRHRGVADRARVAAVADALELAVPRIGRRDPDFELDVRVARRPRGGFDAAERRQRHGGLRARRREGTGGHRRRRFDRHVGNRQRREVRARGPAAARGVITSVSKGVDASARAATKRRVMKQPPGCVDYRAWVGQVGLVGRVGREGGV